MKGICFDSCILVENKLWFVTHNQLFMFYDIVDNQINLIEPSKDEAFFFKNVLDSMFCFEGNIFWVEQDGKRLLQYCIKSNEIYTYVMPDVDYIDWTCFSGVYLIGAAIYFIPRYTQDLIIFDIVSKKFSVKGDFFSKFKLCEDKQIVRKTFLYKDLLFVGANGVVSAYRIRKNEIEEKCSYNIGEGLIDLVYDSTGLWILYKDGAVEKYVNNQKVFDTKVQNSCCHIVNTVKKILLLPGNGDNIYLIDKLSNALNVEENYPEEFSNLPKDNYSKFYMYYDSGSEIILPLRRTSTLLLVDKENGRLSWHKLPQMSEDLLKAIMNYNRKNSKSTAENDECALDIFVSYIKNEV